MKKKDKGNSSHTSKRVVTALSTATIAVLAFIFIPIWLVTPVVALLAALVQFEFYLMVKPKYQSAPKLGTLLGILWMASVGYASIKGGAGLPYANAVMAVFAIAVYVLLEKRFTKPLEAMAVTVFGFMYIPFMLSSFILIAAQGGEITRSGIMTLLWIIAATKLSDMGGFAFGKAWGRHKMCPSISPNKSWEGFGGSIFGGALATWIALLCIGRMELETFFMAIPAGLLFATVGTVGDLVESRIKREVGVKDSATFMPAGLGGFLDMFDSILFTPALVAAVWTWILR